MIRKKDVTIRFRYVYFHKNEVHSLRNGGVAERKEDQSNVIESVEVLGEKQQCYTRKAPIY